MREKQRGAPRAQPPQRGGGHGNQKERGGAPPTENTFGRGAPREKKGKSQKEPKKGFRAGGEALHTTLYRSPPFRSIR